MSTPTPATDMLTGLAAQLNPRVGDQFTLTAERGNPFAKFKCEVTAVKDGWVEYFFTHLNSYGGRTTTSMRRDEFAAHYDPTHETVEARKHAVSLPDYLAYMDDMRQRAEDEEREARQAARDDERVADEVHRQGGRYRTPNPQD